jgi:response regulator RpfG family c-di-GMP phosphodiesterase
MNQEMVVSAVAHPWVLLIVDDESGLHDVSKLVLKRLQYHGRPLEILSAYSAFEAREILETRRDVAVALIDVVMEDDQAGLTLVRDMRETYGLRSTRIILRTGNPGMAPEREVIDHFEIDDYRDKTELTSNRLYTAVYTALRAYQTFSTLDQTAASLEQIINLVGDTRITTESVNFIEHFVEQVLSVVGPSSGALLVKDAVAAVRSNAEPLVLYGSGRFKDWVGKSLKDQACPDLLALLDRGLAPGTIEFSDNRMVISFVAPNQDHFLLWIPSLGKPDPHVVRLVNIFLDKLKLGIQNSRLQEDILEAQRTALSKLCEAVEMRSKETGQHIHRMAKYSALLAELSGLPASQVQFIKAASPLHDIGKVAIPDSILNKPGRLDPQEMEIMQGHARSGWELLADSKSDILRLGADIALTHHERWDGTGYPLGLVGEDIPLHGRIVSLADVFDALMSKRVYKEAFSFEKTAGIIQEGSGSHFDPALVELFMTHGNQFEEIFLQNPDKEH